MSPRGLRSARRRREAARALARPDLPDPVRAFLSAPEPAGDLPWRAATYTVLDLSHRAGPGDRRHRRRRRAPGGGRPATRPAPFPLLVRPDRAVPPEAVRIHGLLPQELEAAPPLATQLEVLLERLAGDVLVVHVAAVDLAFLDAALRRTWGCPLAATALDTARLAAALEHRLRLTRWPDLHRPTWRLAELAGTYGLPAHPEHDPLHDALTTAELFLALASRLERRGLATLATLRWAGGA